MVAKIICLLTGHSVNRHRVWFDGLNFRTRCTRCSACLIREEDGWRQFDGSRDADKRRDRHPRDSRAHSA